VPKCLWVDFQIFRKEKDGAGCPVSDGRVCGSGRREERRRGGIGDVEAWFSRSGFLILSASCQKVGSGVPCLLFI